ncbi:zinc finger CCCH domain-containing protein 24 [Salvia divinorum]|uniref:Zinc finger CCCH domain-containing protein 24 n=1 Tax=Salvia divinorum TaxID=28513 RepID=A0ABD1FMM8_SALDI
MQGKHTVGFLLGNFRESVTIVEEPPIDCPNVSRIACKYAGVFQEFLQQSFLLILFSYKKKPGQIDADNDEASVSEVMPMIQVCTLSSDGGQAKEELHRLAQTFSA